MTLITPSLRWMSKLDYATIDDVHLNIDSYVIGEYVKKYQEKQNVKDFSNRDNEKNAGSGQSKRRGNNSSGSENLAERKELKELVELNVAFRVFVSKLISVYSMTSAPKEFSQFRFYAYLRDTLDERINQAIKSRELAIRNKTAKNEVGLTADEISRLETMEAPGRFPAYSSLQVIAIICKVNTNTTISYMSFVNKIMKVLALDKTISMVPISKLESKSRGARDKNGRLQAKKTDKATEAVKTFILAMKLVSSHILRLGDKPEKTNYFNVLSHVLQKTDATLILEKVVTDISKWMLHRSYSKVLNEKQREAFLLKMETLMRFKDQHNALPLLSRYFEIIYTLCSNRGGSNRRTNTVDTSSYSSYLKSFRSGSSAVGNTPSFSRYGSNDNINVHLKVPFMGGLLSPNPIQRRAFFDLYSKQLQKSDKLNNVYSRLQSVMCQDWDPLNSRFWLPLATECVLSGRTNSSMVELDPVHTKKFPPFQRCLKNIHVGQETGNYSANKRKRRRQGVKQGIVMRLGSVRNNKTLLSPEKNVKLNKFLDEQNMFYDFIGKRKTVDSLLLPLKELSHADQRVAVELWTQLFPEAWSSLNEDSRIALVRPLTSFLSQHYHRKQLKHGGGFGYRRNIIQAMLTGILHCRPMPYLPAELIRFLGKTYNAWHIAIAICEQQVFSNTALKGIDLQQWSESLETLYIELNEKDYGRGVRYMLCKSKETQVSLDLQTNGQWGQAQEVLVNAISEHVERDLSTYETNGWKKDWIESCRQLAQWDVLKSYCASADEPNILMECAWKTPDWLLVKSLFKTSSVTAKVEDTLLPDIKTSMLQIFASIKNWKLDEAEMLYKEGIQTILRKWQSLPASTSTSHIPLFQVFQNFVELQESIIIMNKLHKTKKALGNANSAMPDLTTHLHVWKERLPNQWEDATIWTDVLSWRLHMFDIIKLEDQLRNGSNPAKQNNAKNNQKRKVHDEPWTLLQLCEIAQKQKLDDLSLVCLDKLSQIQKMELSEVFDKLTQQVSMCLEDPSLLNNGLVMLNKTNFVFFTKEQQSELFRLKGLFFERLGDVGKAQESFAKGMCISDDSGEGWLSWAQFYDRLLHIACNEVIINKDRAKDENEMEVEEVDMASKNMLKTKVQDFDSVLEHGIHCLSNAPLSGLRLEYAVNAMSCYLHAVHTSTSSHNTRLILSRVLRLMQCDDPSGRLAAVFDTHVEDTLMWIWIVWLPQLLSLLSCNNNKQVWAILKGLANMFPQALYYSLRAYLLERKDEYKALNKKRKLSSIGTSKNSSDSKGKEGGNGAEATATTATTEKNTDSTNSSKTHTGANSTSTMPEKEERKTTLQYAEDLMHFLRRMHTSLVFEIEVFLEELIVKFKPGPEEELLCGIYALHNKCLVYKSEANKKMNEETLPASIVAILERIHKRFFTKDGKDGTPSLIDRRYSGFRELYGRKFAKDFSTQRRPFLTIESLLRRLIKWKHLLNTRLDLKLSRNKETMRLEDYSPRLMSFSSENVEIPGQYVGMDREPTQEQHIKINAIDADYEILRRPGLSHTHQCRLSIRGNDGTSSDFLVQFAVPDVTRSDSRMAQMFDLLNSVVSSHQLCRQRNISVTVPIVVPITPRIRLFKESKTFVTLSSIYDKFCARNGKDELEPFCMLQNASVVNTNAEFLSPVSHDLILKEQRCQAYDEICSKLVPKDLLSRFVYSKLQSYEAYWHVRKQFTIQTGIIGYLSYLLSMGKQDPHKICINMSSGLVQYADLKPNYKSSLDSENNISTTLGNDESIPFRLTPNISHFISPPGIKGVLTSSMMALSNALKENESFLEDYLHLFLSDDIQAFEKKQDKLKSAEISGYDTVVVGSNDASRNTPDSTDNGDKDGAVDLNFKKRVAKNVKLVLSRINLTTPVNMPPKYDRSTCMTSGRPINEGTRSNNNIRVLIDCAMDQKHLAQMPPNWQSWL